jgi:hypothetical protein
MQNATKDKEYISWLAGFAFFSRVCLPMMFHSNYIGVKQYGILIIQEGI